MGDDRAWYWRMYEFIDGQGFYHVGRRRYGYEAPARPLPAILVAEEQRGGDADADDEDDTFDNY